MESASSAPVSELRSQSQKDLTATTKMCREMCREKILIYLETGSHWGSPGQIAMQDAGFDLRNSIAAAKATLVTKVEIINKKIAELEAQRGRVEDEIKNLDDEIFVYLYVPPEEYNKLRLVETTICVNPNYKHAGGGDRYYRIHRRVIAQHPIDGSTRSIPCDAKGNKL